MKERPILFTGDMVRAILAGIKTQTRRVMNPQPGMNHKGEPFASPPKSPYGGTGDRLWVREHWGYLGLSVTISGGEETKAVARAMYHADGARREARFKSSAELHDATPDQNIEYPANYDDLEAWEQYDIHHRLLDEWWRRKRSIPSIFMPRWASRLDLYVTQTRAERLQDISHEDAVAEGLTCLSKDGGATWKYGIPDRDGLPGGGDDGWPWSDWEVDPRMAYKRIWNAINGKSHPKLGDVSWDANPWVWVVTFSHINKTIRRQQCQKRELFAA